jgi:co-chaperonin GroES (HSP10)
MGLKVVGFRVLVKPDPVEEKTAGGIVVVQDEKLAKAANIKGTLVGVGDQAWKAFSKNYDGEPWAKVGDRVYFSRHAGKIVKDNNGEEFLIMNDEDITCVIEG